MEERILNIHIVERASDLRRQTGTDYITAAFSSVKEDAVLQPCCEETLVHLE